MKQIDKTIEKVDTNDNVITIYFADDGIAVKGNASKIQHVQGILAMISGLIERCGGDPAPVNVAMKGIRKKEQSIKKDVKEDKEVKKDKDIKVAKFTSLEDMLEYLTKEIDSKEE